MADNTRQSIEEMTEGTAKQKVQRDRKDWVGFVEGDVVNFMHLSELDKMTIDDGMGNQAKLVRRKDGSIFVECTSSNVL